LFKIEPGQCKIKEEGSPRRKAIYNNDDPFYKRKTFNRGINQVLNTQEVSALIDPKD
jgi:hypothetical protein